MKVTTSLLLVIILLVAPITAEGADNYTYTKFQNSDCRFSRFNISLDGSTIVIEQNNGGYGVIEITEDYRLYINGDEIELNEEQTERVEEFYIGCMDIVDYGVAIGLKGARIGIDGAKLGLKAIGGVLKLLFTSYDEDDLERDMDREAAKIEAKAELLEEDAERIEEMAEDLEDIVEEMKDEIPELDRVRWF